MPLRVLALGMGAVLRGIYTPQYAMSLDPFRFVMRNGIAYRLPPLVPLTVGTESGLLPTPVSYDATPGGPNNHYKGLGHMARHKWPTPCAGDDRDRGNLSHKAIQRRQSLGKQLMLSMVVDKNSGALNPTWVEWLMGFPLGWTALDASATPSSRRSRKSSGGQS